MFVIFDEEKAAKAEMLSSHLSWAKAYKVGLSQPFKLEFEHEFFDSNVDSFTVIRPTDNKRFWFDKAAFSLAPVEVDLERFM